MLETLEREIQEEASCLLLNATPLAYQEVKHSDGSIYYALYYYCNVEISGKFEGDVAGSITKQEWIKPEDFHNYIKEKLFRRAVLDEAIFYRKNKLNYE